MRRGISKSVPQIPPSACPLGTPSGGAGPVGQSPCFTSQQGCRLRALLPLLPQTVGPTGG